MTMTLIMITNITPGNREYTGGFIKKSRIPTTKYGIAK